MGVSRRAFMITGATLGGGLLLGVGGVGAYLQTHNRVNVQRDANESDISLVNLWIRITPDNHIVIINPHTDMGQGSGTGLMQIVADELDADWSQMQIEQAPAEVAYSNGKVLEGFARDMLATPAWAGTLVENGFYRLGDLMKMQMTGASTAVRFTGWEAMRGAAAATRQMLVSAAASELGVEQDTLITQAGTVVHSATGKSLTYGELAAAAASLDTPKKVTLKEPDAYRYVGRSVARVDIPAKVIANADFGIDADVADMHYAAVVSSGVFGAQPSSIDNVDEVKTARGVSDVLIVPDGVAVVADNPWRAEKAVRSVRFTREPHVNDTLSTESLIATQRKALSEDLTTALHTGSPDNIDATIKAEYLVPYLAHATLEPMNATVWRQNDKLHVVCGVQNPLMARSKVAEVAGLDIDDVVLHARQMGGGFGRRLAVSSSSAEPLNWLIQAVRIAVDTGKPVKTTWSRETDMRSDVYRPMVMAQFEGALADDGKPTLWRSASYGKEMNVKAVAPAYNIPNVSVRFADASHPVPTGFWRSVEHSQHGFFVESFIDELAVLAGADPLEYRMSLVEENSSAANVLAKVADMSGWRVGVDSQGRALGAAMVHSFGSTVAQVVEASMTPAGPRVHRVWCAVDCGFAVNPQAVEAQVQGAVHFALAAALHGRCDLKDGAVVQSNFHDYKLVGMAQSPRVEVALLYGDNPIGGVGEIGVPPLAPALGNALAVINGKRFRTLPFA